jgi:hypothetical protein
VESTELAAAVLSGWAVAWAMTALGADPVPAVIVGLLIWAAVCGTYRRRWAIPRNPPPEPN